jgi:hypothetical protein
MEHNFADMRYRSSEMHMEQPTESEPDESLTGEQFWASIGIVALLGRQRAMGRVMVWLWTKVCCIMGCFVRAHPGLFGPLTLRNR